MYFMFVINYFKKFKNSFFISILFLILIILACTVWQIKINEGRIIHWEPDDHLHFINKATSFNYCEISEECNHNNLISDNKNFDEKSLYKYERQIHRLLLFYHPFYTFSLNLISKFFKYF